MDGTLPAGREDIWKHASRKDTSALITLCGLTALWLCFSLSLTFTLLQQQDLLSILKTDNEQGTALRRGQSLGLVVPCNLTWMGWHVAAFTQEQSRGRDYDLQDHGLSLSCPLPCQHLPAALTFSLGLLIPAGQCGGSELGNITAAYTCPLSCRFSNSCLVESLIQSQNISIHLSIYLSLYISMEIDR